MDVKKMWAVAQMERRNTRRLVRYWVFLSIAYLIGLGAYIYYSVLHAFFSSFSASVGLVGPRYLVGVIGFYYITGFVLGIVFLGFDVRARDTRDGIVEVLDARPLTNLELVAGRSLALFWSALMPIVVLVLIMQGLGFLLPLLGSPVGATIEPLSLVYFVFFMAAPAIVFAIGLVFFVTLLVRHRLVAALVTTATIIGIYWVSFTVPGPVATYLDFIGLAQQEFPSDIVPGLTVAGGSLQRLGVLLFGLGLIGLAAVIHPRLDAESRVHPAAASTGLAVAGLAAIAVVAEMRLGEAESLERWRLAHEARTGEPVADIVALDATVAIDPGDRLEASVEIEFEAPPEAGLERLLLTLNPGLVVDEVTGEGRQALAHTQADGLLEIELARALAPGERGRLTVSYNGRPDTLFGYLDSSLVPETVNLNEAQVALLGYQRGIFERRHVALMPAIRWLPASGTDVGRDDPRSRRKDLHAVELDVALPADWLAAGPGRRRTVGNTAEAVTFRFAPEAPVPEVALVAGRFASFATEVRGITFEVLVHPEHDDNFEVLAHAREEIEDWVGERLEVAERAGLKYPFDAFTLVEVPNTLRSYQGGWRLDTALAPPAMMLLRETSFPTARFDFDVVAAFGVRDVDQAGGQAAVDRNRLVNFFANDLSGGNVFHGAARSFFSHLTGAYGDEAIALDYILEELATVMISGRRGYFSAHLFTDINQTVNSIMSALQGADVVDAVLSAQTSQGGVWNTVLDAPLAEIDPWADPQRTIDTLALKGGQTAATIRDTLGDEAVGRLLARLLERHAGETFTLEALVAAGESVSTELGALLRDWITATGLPGFVVREVEQYRLPDDDNGDARYQLLVRLSNDEPAVGFTRLAWIVPDSSGPGILTGVSIGEGGVTVETTPERVVTSEPIRIDGRSAIEFGVVLSSPATVVRVLPYLSLNREEFVAAQLGAVSAETRNLEPVEGLREAAFDFVDEAIFADDLDGGFAIAVRESEDGLRLSGRGVAEAEGLDQGLPVSTAGAPRAWSRRANAPAAWGRYRHTFAYVRAGQGETRAVMPASLPAAGLWELEVHVPSFYLNFPRGTWNLEIVSDDGREAVSYDAAISNSGWNLVGEYALPAGEVRVEISDRTDGLIVVADAVRWTPARARARAGRQ